MKLAICDDEFVIQTIVGEMCRTQLKKMEVNADIYYFDSGKALVDSKEYFDIIFLDIEMPFLDGMSTARRLMKSGEQTKIIFLTSHVELALEAFKVKAFRYLLKPIDEDKFMEAITEAVNEIVHVVTVLLETGETIKQRDILYIQALGDGVSIHMSKEVYISKNTLKSFKETLAPRMFGQGHKSYLLNYEHVTKIQKLNVEMDNGEQIALSKRMARTFKEGFQDYIRKVSW